MRFTHYPLTIALLFSAAAACGDSDSEAIADAGPGPDAAETPDAARPRSLCPVFENPSCSNQRACVEQSSVNNGEFETVSERCDYCPEFSGTVCTFGECELREDISENQLLLTTGAQATVPVPGLRDELAFWVGMAVQAETAGGEALSCEAIRDGSFDVRNACVNILDVRTDDYTGAQTISPIFNRLPTERDLLFVVYGFAETDASGEPIGVYCSRQFVPAPNGELFEIDSEPDFNFMQVLD